MTYQPMAVFGAMFQRHAFSADVNTHVYHTRVVRPHPTV
jgi:hypothetical protein